MIIEIKIPISFTFCKMGPRPQLGPRPKNQVGAMAKKISRGLGPVGAGAKKISWGHGPIGAGPGPQKTLIFQLPIYILRKSL